MTVPASSGRLGESANVPASLDRLRAGLASPEAAAVLAARPPFGTLSRAAVLALLWSDAEAESPSNMVEGSGPTTNHNPPVSGAGSSRGRPTDGLRVVAIEKTAHLRRHAGQVAFPGGRIEAGETPQQAALREASEEVGIEPATVEMLGELPPASVMASGFDVHSVVGWWRRPAQLHPVDLGEVAAVHQLAVSDLVNPENRATWIHPSGHTGPVFLVDDLFVWGLTGYLLSGLLDLAGWTEPWDATRQLEIPERFFRGRH